MKWNDEVAIAEEATDGHKDLWLVSDLSKGNLKQVHKGGHQRAELEQEDQILFFNGRCLGRVDLLESPVC